MISVRKISLILLFFTISAQLFAVKWSLQITDPEHDLNHFPLDEKKFKPYLDRTSWRCWISATEKKGAISLKRIRCNYSIKNSGEFTIVTSCGPSRPYSETFFDLLDEKKDLLYQFMLICKQ